MLDAIGSGERFQRGDVIGADAHDLGARGFELGEVRLEAADLARSDGAEGLDDRVDDDRPLAQELAELHRLVAGPGHRGERTACSTPARRPPGRPAMASATSRAPARPRALAETWETFNDRWPSAERGS